MAQTPNPDPAALAEILRKQQGVISRRQARACGMTQAALVHRLRRGGPWRKLLPGVYLAFTGSATADQRDMAALLYAGPSSVLTGEAALRHHRIRGIEPKTIDVLVPPRTQRQSIAFVRVRHSGRMPGQICVIGELRFAMIPRAVADGARALGSLREVRSVVSSAVQQRRCPLSLLAAELEEGPSRGSANLRIALAEVADGLRSPAESDFKDLLRHAKIPEPMFNARLLDGDTLIAIADCWWDDAGVAAEVDSREWHFSPAEWERTLQRHAALSGYGVIVLHFTPHQIKTQREEVIKTIKAALAEGRRRPQLRIRAIPSAA